MPFCGPFRTQDESHHVAIQSGRAYLRAVGTVHAVLWTLCVFWLRHGHQVHCAGVARHTRYCRTIGTCVEYLQFKPRETFTVTQQHSSHSTDWTAPRISLACCIGAKSQNWYCRCLVSAKTISFAGINCGFSAMDESIIARKKFPKASAVVSGNHSDTG